MYEDVQFVATLSRPAREAFLPACPSFSNCGLSLCTEKDAFLIFTCHTFLLHIFLMDGALKY
jgi:hypothetical protein